VRQGVSQHEAIHRVGAVLTDEIWHILNEKRPFDEAGFVRKLRRLAESETRRSVGAPRSTRLRYHKKRR
jgi:hypothetical protein